MSHLLTNEEIYELDANTILNDSESKRMSVKRKKKVRKVIQNDIDNDNDCLLRYPIVKNHHSDVLYPVKKSTRQSSKGLRKANYEQEREEKFETPVLKLKQGKISNYIPSLSHSSKSPAFTLTKSHNKEKIRSNKKHCSSTPISANLNLITNYTSKIIPHKLSHVLSGSSPPITPPQISPPEDPDPEETSIE